MPAPKLNFRLITSKFFDRAEVIRITQPQERKYLARSGALVRSIARRSMRKGYSKRHGRVRSQPGEPPRRHGNPLLYKFMFFWLDDSDMSVKVGPAALYKQGRAADVLEKGGTVPYGWMKGKHLKARPYMEPALENAQPQLQQIWDSSKY